jgi:hypothetical protein
MLHEFLRVEYFHARAVRGIADRQERIEGHGVDEDVTALRGLRYHPFIWKQESRSVRSASVLKPAELKPVDRKMSARSLGRVAAASILTVLRVPPLSNHST